MGIAFTRQCYYFFRRIGLFQFSELHFILHISNAILDEKNTREKLGVGLGNRKSQVFPFVSDLDSQF